tara:strand:+ start:956 stop:2875 length:1920 start_codon:yes stop_codon:yes gene_type:complete
MGNILLDMMGLLSRKRVVKNTEDTDYVVLGRTPNPTDGMFTSPKMTNELITIGNLRTMVGDSIWMPVTGGINYPGGNVGIGATTPGAKLDVDGDALINGLTVGQGAGTSIYGNTVFGKSALDSITTGLRNVAIANEAQLNNTTGNHNVAIGFQSLKNNIAGNNNTAIGYGSLMAVNSKDKNTAVGYLSLGLVGGINSGSTNDTGKNNTAIGYGAGYVRVGGTNGNSSDSVFIGSLTQSNGLASVNEIVIGTDAISAGSNTVVLGNDLITSTRLKGNVIVANGNVGIGTTNPSAKLEVYGTTPPQVKIGYDANNYAQINVDSSGNVVVSSTGNGFVPPSLELSTGSGFIKINGSADGNVGIGTSGPSEKLTIRNGINNTNVKILSYSSAAGTEAALKFSTIDSESNSEKAAIIARNASGDSFGRSDMHFALNSAADSGNVQISDTKMTITRGGNILFNNYTATATQTGANALDPIQLQKGFPADTLATLSVDPTGQVVRGSQEATWSFTLAQLNALTNTKVTLLSAPGSGKAIVVEESNWFMESDPTGSGNFLSDLVCEIDGISTNAVATQLVTARMTEIAASTFNGLGIYSRDVPELNRVYRFNSAMTIRAPAGINSFPSRCINIKLKIKYRVFDKNTF